MITRTAHGKSLTGGYQRSPRASAGGLADVAKKGRNGDTMLAHINPEEAQMLKRHGGSGETNPLTGLPEYNQGPPQQPQWRSLADQLVRSIIAPKQMAGASDMTGPLPQQVPQPQPTNSPFTVAETTHA